jgi:hypothetical protein
MAYYGGEEQRKKDEKKKKVDAFMNKAMPKRTFDQMGRETDRRTGKLLETQLDDLFSDPLEDLWNLHEAEMGVMQKPQIETDQPSAYGGPNDGNYQHPVAMKRAALDAEMHQGHNPVEAHQSVHGDVDLADTTSKKMLAGTLGRVQDESSKNGVVMEPDKGSLLYKDHELEKQLNQVTHDDMRTPMRGQVPDRLQTPADEVAEETEVCYNYMDDVQFLQKYGRA